MEQWTFFVLYSHLTPKEILQWFTLCGENVVNSIHFAFSYLCFLVTFFSSLGWISDQDSEICLPQLMKTLYTDILRSVNKRTRTPTGFCSFSRCCQPVQNWLNLMYARGGKSSQGNTKTLGRLSKGQSSLRTQSVRCFLQVPTGFRIIKIKK